MLYLRSIDTAVRQDVATVGALSPINKVLGSSGRRDLPRKHDQVLRSEGHRLEINLLRAPDVLRRDACTAVLHRAGSRSPEA